MNGIVGTQTWVEKDTLYVKVDPVQTKLADFYSFEQLTKQQTKGTEECWRTFFLLNEPTWDGFFDPTILQALQTIQKKCKP